MQYVLPHVLPVCTHACACMHANLCVCTHQCVRVWRWSGVGAQASVLPIRVSAHSCFVCEWRGLGDVRVHHRLKQYGGSATMGATRKCHERVCSVYVACVRACVYGCVHAGKRLAYNACPRASVLPIRFNAQPGIVCEWEGLGDVSVRHRPKTVHVSLQCRVCACKRMHMLMCAWTCAHA